MKRNSKMFLFIVMLLLTGSSCFLMTSCQKDYDGQLEIIRNQLKAGENSYTELKEQITSLEERVTTAYSGGYPFSISGDIRSVPS